MRVQVMSHVEYRDWCGGLRALGKAEQAKRLEIVPMVIWDNGQFLWVCPDCGRGTLGQFGDQPVSGWNEPRWTREGDDGHLTLSPSLGCPGFRTGECTGGHYWLRDGELLAA